MIIYNINKVKGTIVARFEGDKDYWRQSLIDMCANIFKCADFYMPNDVVDSVLDDYSNFIGKARLHPNDVWNEEKGKHIAKQRLLLNWERVKKQMLDKLHEIVYRNYRLVEKRINKRRAYDIYADYM